MVQWNLTVGPDVLSSHYKLDPAHLLSDIQRLNRTEAMILCAKLNLICGDGLDKNPIAGQQYALRLLANDGLISRGIYKKLTAELRKGNAYPFNRPGLLELVRWLSQLASERADNIGFLPQIQLCFYRALFSCSMLYTERDISPFLGTAETETEQRRLFLPGLRRAVNWGREGGHPLMMLGRAWLLLKEEFFDKYPVHAATFKERTGFDIEDWFTCAAGIIFCTMLGPVQSAKTLKNLYEWDADTIFQHVPEMVETFNKFVSLLAQTPDEMARSFGSSSVIDTAATFNFRVMRSRPILRVSQSRAIVIDHRLYFNSIAAGPLFIVSSETSDRAAFKDYGAACHKYALGLLNATDARLDDSLKAKYILDEAPARYLGSECSISDIAFGDEKTVALVEAKGVWLNDADLDEATGQAFWQLVRNKYGASTNTRTGRPIRKGVAQLADLIKNLSSGALVPDEEGQVVSNAETILPILLVQDSLVATSLFSHFLALDFVQMFDLAELPKTGQFMYEDLIIHTPIILSLRDLELLEGVVLDVPLVKLLEEFSSQVTDRADSLSIFLDHRSPKLAIWPDANRLVKTAATALLDRIIKQCFPNGAN